MRGRPLGLLPGTAAGGVDGGTTTGTCAAGTCAAGAACIGTLGGAETAFMRIGLGKIGFATEGAVVGPLGILRGRPLPLLTGTCCSPGGVVSSLISTVLTLPLK